MATSNGGTTTRPRPTPRPSTRQQAPSRQQTQPRRNAAPARRTAPPRRPKAPRTLTLGDPHRRLRSACVVLAIILSLFVGRLVQLQAVEAPGYAARAEAGRLRTVTLPADRGNITDVNGVVLSTSVAAKNVTADQTLVHDPAATAAALSPVLGLSVSDLTEKLTGTKRFAYVARQITPELWSNVQSLKLAGIFSEDTTVRTYPAGDLAASVLGFVARDGSGLGGIELAQQRTLAGVAGQNTFEAAAHGREIPTSTSTEQQAIPGSTVRLTIDRDIQWAAQQALAAEVKAANATSGSVVVEDVRTGALLALATAPSFDPGDPGSVAIDARGNPALSDIYEPGSTSKIMTMAAVLQEGKLTANSPITVPSQLTRGGSVFHDSHAHGTEHLTLTGVLAKSSNLGTILASETIGPDTLYGYLKKFGIGDPTGIHFPGESRGLLPPPNEWSQTTFPTVAFGQGLSVNAVQATSVFATIANNGLRVSPSLVAGTVAPDGTFTSGATPTTTRVVSAKTAATLRAMLEAVTSDEGTAPMARIPGYRVAGKTGTANRVDPACSCYRGYTASFIGFAPADAPRLVVAVTLQNPKNGHYGGRLAGPVFKKVMSFALQSLGIPPTGTKPARMRLVLP